MKPLKQLEDKATESIRISVNVKKRLNQLKKYGETYNDVILRLITELEKSKLSITQ